MTLIQTLIGCVLFAVISPVIGCLLSGVDRIVSARMQGRIGPSVLQPYYDVRKLLSKEYVSTNRAELTYILLSYLFVIVAGGIFFSGGNFLLCIFIATLAALFFIVAAYSSRSPYADLGAGREIIQVTSYEPMVLFVAVVFYLNTGSFDVSTIFSQDAPIICNTWLAFLGLLYILTIKLRKSPFDISMSHHAHQEIVRGTTTEMSGPTLALVEVMHWCENVLFIAWVGMFFVCGNPLSIALAVVVCLLVFFLEILIDNTFARVKWQLMFKSAWIVALVFGGANIAYLILC